MAQTQPEKSPVLFVVADTPKNGQEIVLFSLKPRGVDVIIPSATVSTRWTLGGYYKYTVEGTTDKGGHCQAVVRTSESNEDELQVLEVNFS